MDFVLIANAWAAGADNPTSKHRIAMELARRGCRVLWVEGAGMRRPSLARGSDRSRMLARLVAAVRSPRRVFAGSGDGGGVWALSPLSVPLPRWGAVRALNGWWYGCAAWFWAKRLRLRDPVLVNYVPVLAGAMAYWRRRVGLCARELAATGIGDQRSPPTLGRRETGVLHPARIVYHCVDRWDAFAMYDAGVMAHADERCCREADVVIASSMDLQERCRRFARSVHRVTHGVDYRHFAQALDAVGRPDDLPAGRIAGFFGLLSEWVDQDLLLRLGEAVSRLPFAASVVLIGPSDVPIDRLRSAPGIRCLGPRRFDDLPRYAANFDAGIIPFCVNELTRAVNPIKLREMMAAGCPVVSTPLPEVVACAAGREGVGIAADGRQFVDLVLSRLASPATAEQRAEMSRSVAAETWEAKVDEILRCIEGDRRPARECRVAAQRAAHAENGSHIEMAPMAGVG